MTRRTTFDLAPLLALLVFWATAGLWGAGGIAATEGDARYLWLGVVTCPALAIVGEAMRRVWRGRDA